MWKGSNMRRGANGVKSMRAWLSVEGIHYNLRRRQLKGPRAPKIRSHNEADYRKKGDEMVGWGTAGGKAVRHTRECAVFGAWGWIALTAVLFNIVHEVMITVE